MKRIHSLLILLLTVSFLSVAQNQPGTPWQIKVMSYNVQHCAGIKSDVDYDRTAEVIFKQQADVVALQELDSMTT